MTDIEFDIIDELYFVTPYNSILKNLGLPEKDLCGQLLELIKKGYIKSFYPDPDTEVEVNAETFEQECTKYYFLATKAGLLAHNSR